MYVYIRFDGKFIILLANLDVQLGSISLTHYIVGRRWNNHGWMVILHFNKVCSVYRPFVVTTKLSSICVDEKEEEEEEKTDRTRCCNSWHHTQAERRRHARQASKKKGSVYVIEDTTRRREREERQKKYEWNSMLASMEAV